MGAFTRRGLLKSIAATALIGMSRPALALTPAQRAVLFGAAPFDPVSLFAKYSASGFYYNFAGSPTRTLGSGLLVPMYQDSVGTVVDADGESIGLAIDESEGAEVGADLVTNGGFGADSDWKKSSGAVTIAGGKGVFTAAASGASLYQSAITGAGWHLATFDVESVSAGAVSLYAPGYSADNQRNANGSYTESFYATGSGNLELKARGTTTLNVDNVSVKPISGNHGFQTTAAAKPTFKTGSPNYASFDGGDYLDSGLVPASAMTLATCIRTTATSGYIMASINAGGSPQGRCGLWVSTSKIGGQWGDDTASLLSDDTYLNTDAVVLMRGNASKVELWIDGVLKKTISSPSTAPGTTYPLFLGCVNNVGTPAVYFTGRQHRDFAMQAYVSDADVVPLMRALGAGVVSI